MAVNNFIHDYTLCFQKTPDVTGAEKSCPADREELGRATWTFLHTMAAYYPEQPSKKQGEEMTRFIASFSCFYPCEDCAQHMQARYVHNPIMTSFWGSGCPLLLFIIIKNI